MPFLFMIFEKFEQSSKMCAAVVHSESLEINRAQSTTATNTRYETKTCVYLVIYSIRLAGSSNLSKKTKNCLKNFFSALFFRYSYALKSRRVKTRLLEISTQG